MTIPSAFRLAVDGAPPGYDGGFSISNPKHTRHGQYSLLRAEAMKAMAGQQVFSRETEVSLTINWERATKRGTRSVCDSANAISGVANTLQGIVYVDDEQITEIHYTETAAGHDRYVIEVAVR